MAMAPEVLNFYAGPTALPAPVIERIRRDLGNFGDTGMGVMEISHRAPEIEHLVYAHAQKNIGIAGVTLVIIRKELLRGNRIEQNLPASRSAMNVTFTEHEHHKHHQDQARQKAKEIVNA